jgi:hypothetical protein
LRIFRRIGFARFAELERTCFQLNNTAGHIA